MIVTYGPEHIPAIWNEIEPFIKKALDRGSIYTLEDVYDNLRECRMQLWCYRDPKLRAVLTTGIIGDECFLITLGGNNIQDWIDAYPIIERWAIEQGCGSMKIHGRKGWAKILGFEIVSKDHLNLYVMEKLIWDQAHNSKTDSRPGHKAA